MPIANTQNYKNNIRKVILEDVDKCTPRLLVQWSVIILLWCFIQTSVYAATQGKPDRSYSRGTVSITLEIPESTRLVASQFNEGVCLHVLDSAIRESSHFYNIAGLNGMHDVEFENDQQTLDASVKTLQLKNFYGLDSQQINECVLPTKIQPELVDQDSQSILLMLIVE